MRQEALAKFVAREVEGSPGRMFLENSEGHILSFASFLALTPPRFLCHRFFTELEANEILYNIYFSPPSPETNEKRRIFFAASLDAWSLGVANVLNTLEEDMIGPFALGDEVVSPALLLSFRRRFLSRSSTRPSSQRPADSSLLLLVRQLTVPSRPSHHRLALSPSVRFHLLPSPPSPPFPSISQT